MISFQKLDYEHLEQVLEWRTSPHVTQYMYTDIEKNIDNQMKWFEKVKDDTTQENWIIQYKDENIGLFTVNKMDYKNQTVSSGFYIGNLEYAILSSRIIPYYLNYIFQTLNFNKLYIEVMGHNENIMKMNLHYGFRHVGTLQQHIKKHDIFYNVELLELLKEDWMSNFTKYHKLMPVIK